MTATWNPHTARPDIDPDAYEQHLDDEAAEEAGLLPPLVPTPSVTLEQLAATANEAGARIARREGRNLEDAFIAGRALLDAQAMVLHQGLEEWEDWATCNITSISMSTVRRYMLVAAYREAVMAAGKTTINKAVEFLSETGLSRDLGIGRRDKSKYDRSVIQQLHADGKTASEISKITGAAWTTVSRQLNPDEWRDRDLAARVKRAAEKKALERQERHKAFKDSTLDEVYSNLRRLCQSVDRAVVVDTRSQRILSQFLSDLHRNEDKLNEALGFEHGL